MQLDPATSLRVREDAGPSWHALYTRHQHEKTIAALLSAEDFEVFLPLRSAIHYWKDRRKTILLPVFPCYVFLRGGLDRRVQVLSTPGVYSIVGSDGHPSPIPPSQIDAIRRTVERGLALEPCPFLTCGNWVRVTSGSLTGIEGMLLRRKGSGRLVLSVELLQKSVAVDIGVDAVEQIAAPRRRWVAGWGPAHVQAQA